jgi:hypothetical protein
VKPCVVTWLVEAALLGVCGVLFVTEALRPREVVSPPRCRIVDACEVSSGPCGHVRELVCLPERKDAR